MPERHESTPASSLISHAARLVIGCAVVFVLFVLPCLVAWALGAGAMSPMFMFTPLVVGGFGGFFYCLGGFVMAVFDER